MGKCLINVNSCLSYQSSRATGPSVLVLWVLHGRWQQRGLMARWVWNSLSAYHSNHPTPTPLSFSPILITSFFSDRSGNSWWPCLLWFKVDLKKHQSTVFHKPHCANPWRYISEIELLDLQIQSREHLLICGSKRQSRCALLYQTKRKEISTQFSQASPAIKG